MFKKRVKVYGPISASLWVHTFIRIEFRRPYINFPDSDLSQSSTHLNSPGSIQPIRLPNHIAISSCPVLSHGWVNQSPNDSIAVASNTRPYDYESGSLTTALPLPHPLWKQYWDTHQVFWIHSRNYTKYNLHHVDLTISYNDPYTSVVAIPENPMY
jgi:hypothetical protein